MKTKSKGCLEKLPCEILVLIISNLKLKEAARNSVLSRTWRNLWKYTSGVLDFVKPFNLHTWSRSRDFDEDDDHDEPDAKMRFVEWVNLVLDVHRSSDILGFRVKYNLDEEDSSVINSWISFALQRNVKRLVLDFRSYSPPTYAGDYALRIPLFSNSTASLIVLHLVRVNLNTQVLEFILSKFPMLQDLHLESILNKKELKIIGPSPNLKRLTIRDCLFYSLEVYAINLLSFVYRGPKINVTFKVYPRLVEADIPGSVLLNKKAYHLSTFFSRLESLILNLTNWSVDTTIPDFPMIRRVRRLELPDFPKLPELTRLELYLSGDIFEDFLCRCATLLEACPSLLRFILQIYDPKGSTYSLKNLREWTTSKHEHVKIMELIGFLGEEVDVMLAHKLLDMLPCLEKLYVDPNLICNFRSTSKDYEQSIAAAKRLHYSLPPNIDLTVGRRYRNYKTY